MGSLVDGFPRGTTELRFEGSIGLHWHHERHGAAGLGFGIEFEFGGRARIQEILALCCVVNEIPVPRSLGAVTLFLC